MNVQVYFGAGLFLLLFFWLFYRDGGLVVVKMLACVVGIGVVVMVSLAYDTWAGWPAANPMWGRPYQLIQVHTIPQGQNEILIVWGIPQFPIKKKPSWNPFAKNPELPGTPLAFYLPDTPRNERDMMRTKMALRKGLVVFGSFYQESVGKKQDGNDDGNGERGKEVIGKGGETKNFKGKDSSAEQLNIGNPAEQPGVDKAPTTRD